MARLSGPVLFYVWMCLCLSASLTSGLRAERTKERRVGGQINCMNFVFHPKCRGTAAKRAPPAGRSSPETDSNGVEPVGDSSYDSNSAVSSISDENGYVMDRDIAARLLESLPLSRAKIPVPVRTEVPVSGPRDKDVMALAAEAVAMAQADPRNHRAPDADGTGIGTGTWEGAPSVASRYGWVLFRKRAKEQELTYDY